MKNKLPLVIFLVLICFIGISLFTYCGCTMFGLIFPDSTTWERSACVGFVYSCCELTKGRRK